MTKYSMLLSILDRIRDEAASTQRANAYLPNPQDADRVNQARSRAFVHLYLKVSFGLLDFTQREHFITDGTADGGIDGYYIENDSKMIYLIQSKFRTTEKNFIAKQLSLPLSSVAKTQGHAKMPHSTVRRTRRSSELPDSAWRRAHLRGPSTSRSRV